MSIHLIKLAVGCDDVPGLAQVQQHYLVDYHGQPAIPVRTRNTPKRAKELLDSGGSLYRVMKSRIQCRHEILGIDTVEDDEAGKFCLIMVSPTLIRTVAQPHRPFQGWRYFEPAKAPKDIGAYVEGEDLPPEDMADDLSAMGLL